MSAAKTLVVSPSHWHVPLYAEAIAQAHHVIAVSDADETRASAFAEMWDARLYSSWSAMLDAHEDAELAYVFAPHYSMHEICLAVGYRQALCATELADEILSKGHERV